MEIDALGTYNMSHAVYPAMARNSSGGGKGGIIINISMTLHYGATWYQVSSLVFLRHIHVFGPTQMLTA
jgi:NAD(P)-dependent dehydrogenase (short-subunit alcohol dehydrogenase family)